MPRPLPVAKARRLVTSTWRESDGEWGAQFDGRFPSGHWRHRSYAATEDAAILKAIRSAADRGAPVARPRRVAE